MSRVVGDEGERDVSTRVGEMRQRPQAARPEDRPALRPDAPGLWAVDQVAAYLQVSVHAVYKMTARKAVVRIPHIRIGGKLRFRPSDIDRWLTLLTVSNLEVLSRMRRHLSQVYHGHDSQTPTP